MQSAPARKFHRPIKVLIVDDQAAIRQMLSLALSEIPEFKVVAEAGSLREAVRLTRRREPDVVILDWIFPGGGAAFLQALHTIHVHPQVLVLSADTTGNSVREALTGGAKGYLEKTAGFAELVEALRTVAAGGVYFGSVVCGVIERLVRRPEAPATDGPLPSAEPAAGRADDAPLPSACPA